MNIFYTTGLLLFLVSLISAIELDQINHKMDSPHESIKLIFSFPHKGYSMAMTELERAGTECSFEGANCKIEVPEHDALRRYLLRGDSVMEFGSRYGTTTCEIAHRIGNTGRLITVEVDSSVFGFLERNLLSHHCNAYIVHVPIGNNPVNVDSQNYASRGFIDTSGRHQNAENKVFYSFTEIQKILFEVDVLLIDCEGCINQIFQGMDIELEDALKNIHTIIIETDMGFKAADCHRDCVDWTDWIRRLKNMYYQLVYASEERSDLWHIVLTKRIFISSLHIPDNFPYNS